MTVVQICSFTCDHAGCEANVSYKSPTAPALRQLKEAGWVIRNGKFIEDGWHVNRRLHYCPEHGDLISYRGRPAIAGS